MSNLADLNRVREVNPVWVHRLFWTGGPSHAFDLQAEIPSFENIIRDSELLVSYAAMAGTRVSDGDFKTLTTAVEKYRKDPCISPNEAGHDLINSEILVSYNKVANQLLPVTTLGIRRFFGNYKGTIRFYLIWGVILAILVIMASLLIFVSTSISDSIKGEIDLANSKAITLRARFGNTLGAKTAGIANRRQSTSDTEAGVTSKTYSEQDMLIDLQQLAISTRSIDGKAMQLRQLILPGIPDPFKDERSDKEAMKKAFELDPALAHPSQDFTRIVTTYQKVRAYAQSLRDGITFWYGGLAASVLPILYAILGVCAWSLRRMQVAIRDKNFSDPSAKEQMLVAVIAGMLISLFSGLFALSVSLSPLAWAFLAGYSSDAFFQVLDGLFRIRNEAPVIR